MTDSDAYRLQDDNPYGRPCMNLITAESGAASSPTVQAQKRSGIQDLKKLIGYVRVSTLGQENEGESLCRQEHNLTTFAHQFGVPIHALYRETGSGMWATLNKRPGLEQASIMSKDTGYPLICTSLDRLGRNHDLIVREILEAGIRVIDVSRGRELTDAELKRDALAAQREGECIRRATKRALRAVEGHSSIGSKTGGDIRGLQISQDAEDHAGEVMMIVNQIERLAGRSVSNSEMARELTKRRVPTFTNRGKAAGGIWHHYQVSRVRSRLPCVFIDPD